MKTWLKVVSLVFLLLVVAAGIGLVWFLRSDRFQELARSALESRLEEATGLSCRVDRLRLDVFRGSFSIEGLALASRPGSAGVLTLIIDKAAGSFGLSSPWGQRVRLAELNLTRPRIEIVAAQTAARWDPEELLRTIKTSVDLAVGRVVVQDGSIEWSNRRIPFDLSLENLVSEIHHRSSPPSYRIRLAYTNSHVVWGHRDLSHSLEAQVVLSMDGIEIDSVEVRRNMSVVAAKGGMKNWKAPLLTLQAVGEVSAAKDLSLLYPATARVQGNVGFTADLRWDAAGIFASGRLKSQSLGYHGAFVNDLQGSFGIKDAVLSLRDVVGRLGKGNIRAAGNLQLSPATTTPDRMEVTAKNVALVNAALILNVPEIAFQNTVDARMSLSWLHGLEDLDASADVDLHGSEAAVPAKSTALQGNLKLSYDHKAVSIHHADLQSGHTTIKISEIADRRFDVRATTDMLPEPLNLLRGLSSTIDGLVAKTPDLMTVSGIYELAGEAEINSLTLASYRGGVRVTGGRWRSFSFDNLSARASWDGRQLELQSLSVRRGAERAEGDLALKAPLQEGQFPIVTFRGSVQGVSLGALRELGLGPTFELTGALTGSGSVSGTQGSWRGEGRLDIENGSFKGEPFDSIRGTFQSTDRLLRVADARVRRGAGQIDLRGEVELTGEQQIKVSAQLAPLSLREVPIVEEKKLDIEGRLAGSGDIRGTLANPLLSGAFTLDGLRYESWDLGQGNGTISLENKLIKGTVAVRSELGSFEAQGSVSAEPGYPGKALLQFKDWNARKILSGKIPPFLSDLSTTLQGSLDIQGRFAEPRTVTGAGKIEGGRFKVNDYELRNAGSMQFRIADQKLRIDKVTMVGEGTNLDLSGTIPLDASPALDLGLNGGLNLVVLQMAGKRARISGAARLNVKATGSLRNPQVVGQAALDNARLAYGDLPFQLSSLQGGIFFSRDLVRLENVQGNVASGTMEISGFLEPRNGELANAELQISVRRARLPYPTDFRSIVDAELFLRGGPESQLLSGEVNVLRAEYMRNLNIFELLASRSTASGAPLVTDPFLLGLRLDLTLHSDGGLLIDNALTKMRGGMRLLLRGSPAYPSLTGHVEASDGTIFFRGNKFDIMHATADLMDRNRINPVLDIRAEADVKAYRLVLNVNGNMDHLNVNVTSDPPLSTVDIVSLLATGKSAGSGPGIESSRYQSEVTGVTAASLLSESLTGVIGKRVERIFGFQSFRVDPFLAGAENDPTARVTISESISKDLTVTFSRNLSTNEEQIVIVEYDVSRDLSIVATRDEKGQFGLDFRFRRRYR